MAKMTPRSYGQGRTARAPEARLSPAELEALETILDKDGANYAEWLRRKITEDTKMSNSYGAGQPPEDAIYGVYDSDNGEWVGRWFSDKKSAQKEANKLRNDKRLGVVSTTDDDDWL